MSMFLVYVVGLIALALAMVLPSLLRRRAVAAAGAAALPDARQANVRVLREQLAALEADREAGVLDDSQYRLARAEIERRALEEEQAVEHAPVVARRATGTAVLLAVCIPVFAVMLYAALGQPQALEPVLAAAPPQGEVTLPQIEAMVDGLAKRLESQTAPQEGDLQAWTMLANSYAVLQRFPEASKAFARARALAPDNAQLLADHADVLAMMQGQSVEGEPGRLVMRALQLEPTNLKALTMAGSWAFERRDYAGAVNYWSQAQPLAPPGSDFAAGLANSLQQARAAAAQSGQLAAAGADKALPQQAASGKPTATASAGQVSGEVQVTDVLAKRVRPTDTVFVFARAADGARMPLGIIKRAAGELPFSFTLDDSSAMSPQHRISGVKQVIIGARISPSGDATPRTGDLTGQIGPVDVGSGKLVLMIDGVVP